MIINPAQTGSRPRTRTSRRCGEHISIDERGKLHALESLGIDEDHRIITETHMIISNDLCHDIGAVQHFCSLLVKHVKEQVRSGQVYYSAEV